MLFEGKLLCFFNVENFPKMHWFNSTSWTMVEFLHQLVIGEIRSMVEVLNFCLYHVMKILLVISNHETLFMHM
jgi:hypothetical protein